MHGAMTYLTMSGDDFCWPVRTPRGRDTEGVRRRRAPAMAARLADHVWSLEEWPTFPAVQ